MVYECKTCLVCGGEDIKELKRELKQEDVFITYSCASCNGVFQSAPKKALKEQPVKRQGGLLSAAEIFQMAKPCVLELTCSFSDKTAVGTGYIISKEGHVLTNAHVVVSVDEESDKITNLSETIIGNTKDNAFVYQLEFITADVKRDIALLKLSQTATSFLPLKEVTAQTGDKVYAVGNSKGEGLCIVDGIVSDCKRMMSSLEHIMISAMVTTGNSGGPVFSEKGSLIGMVVSGRKEAAAMNYAIPVQDILAFIRNVEQEEDVKILK